MVDEPTSVSRSAEPCERARRALRALVLCDGSGARVDDEVRATGFGVARSIATTQPHAPWCHHVERHASAEAAAVAAPWRTGEADVLVAHMVRSVGVPATERGGDAQCRVEAVDAHNAPLWALLHIAQQVQPSAWVLVAPAPLAATQAACAHHTRVRTRDRHAPPPTPDATSDGYDADSEGARASVARAATSPRVDGGVPLRAELRAWRMLYAMLERRASDAGYLIDPCCERACTACGDAPCAIIVARRHADVRLLSATRPGRVLDLTDALSALLSALGGTT